MQSGLSQSPSADHDPSSPWVSRRAVLALGGTAAASTLAGCHASNVAATATPVHDGDWRSYGSGPANANRVAGGLPDPTAHEVLASGDWPYTPPVVHGDVVYFAADREVVAVTTDGRNR